jgi:SET domain-containing protein
VKIIPSDKIYVNYSPIHGLGVFAKKKIKEGDVFEICPVIDLGMKYGETSYVLLNYRFNWPSGTTWEKQVVGLGYASLYNHSESPNADWRSVYNDNVFEFFSLRDIEPNEEIFVYYGGQSYWEDGRTSIEIK